MNLSTSGPGQTQRSWTCDHVTAVIPMPFYLQCQAGVFYSGCDVMWPNGL